MLSWERRGAVVGSLIFGKVTPVDSNNTMDKVLGGLESLIEQFTGEDLGDEVIKEARRQVELKLKAEMRRQQKNSGTTTEKLR